VRIPGIRRPARVLVNGRIPIATPPDPGTGTAPVGLMSEWHVSQPTYALQGAVCTTSTYP